MYVPGQYVSHMKIPPGESTAFLENNISPYIVELKKTPEMDKFRRSDSIMDSNSAPE